MTWFEWLVDPLSYPFMQRALLVAIATGVVSALLSCFIVLKGWSLMGDAISHAVLPGIILAYLIGMPLFIGAFTSGIGCALATGYIKNHCRLKEDTVMGIVYSGLFALGLVLFSKIDTEQHLTHILFGNVLGVSYSDLYQTVILTTLISLCLLVKRRDLMLYCFDATQAKVLGLPVKLLHYGLLSLLALAIIAALQAVGVILAIALLIAPGMIAFLLCRRFEIMLFIAVVVSVIACTAGTLISYYLDGATGACIVLTLAGIFVLVQFGRFVINKCISAH